MFHRIPFFIKICISGVSNFNLRDHWSSTILASYLSFWQLKVSGFQLYFFCTHDVFFYIYTSKNIYGYKHFSVVYWYILIWITLFLSWNSHLHLHHMCFVNVFDWFILLIILKTPRFKSYILFGMHTRWDRSLGVLQLPTYLPKLTAVEESSLTIFNEM